jgi:protein phosphatase 1 regulatory subunit 7
MSAPDASEKPSILSETSPDKPATDGAASITHKHSSSSSSLHNAQGWDGKLRVEKKAVLVNPEVLDGYVSENEESDEDAVKVDQIEADEGTWRLAVLVVHTHN